MAAVLFQPLFDRITFFTRFGMFTCLGEKLLSSQSPIPNSPFVSHPHIHNVPSFLIAA